MKRNGLIILLLLCSVILTVLANDYTYGEVRDDKLIIGENSKIINVSSEACFKHIYVNAEDLTENAYNVIIGEIVELEYIDNNANARTICTVEVDEVLEGNEIVKGERIQILEYQGYCRLSKFVEVYGDDHFKGYDMSHAESEFLKYTVEGEPLVSVGEKYVYFLSPELSNSEIEGNYYEIMGTFMGKYLIKDGLCDRYEPTEDFYDYMGKERSIKREGVLTLEELKNIIMGMGGK